MGQPTPTPHEAARELHEILQRAQSNLNLAARDIVRALSTSGGDAERAISDAAANFLQAGGMLSNSGWQFYGYPEDRRSQRNPSRPPED